MAESPAGLRERREAQKRKTLAIERLTMGKATETLKRMYSSAAKVENIGLIQTALLKSVRRTNSPLGESFNSLVTVSGGVGWGSSRSSVTAISSQGAAGDRLGNGSFQQITNKRGKLSGECKLSEELIKNTDAGDAAFGRHLLMVTQEHLAQLGPMAESWISHEDSFLWAFQGTLSAGGLITLTSNPEHISRIRPDMVLLQTTTVGGTTISATVGYVVAIDRLGATPTVTVAASPGGAGANPGTWLTTAGLNYYVLGTTTTATSPTVHPITTMPTTVTALGADNGVNTAFIIDNLSSWCPAAAPGAALFKGMNRAVDTLLGGVRITAAEAAPLNLLQRAEALAVRGKSRAGWNDSVKNLYVHTVRFNQMQQLLQQTDNRERGFSGSSGKAEFGYNYIDMVSTGARIHIVECPAWDPNTMWMIQPEDWNLHSAAGWPSVVSDDGIRLVRAPDDDEYRLQYTGHGSFRTVAPNRLGRAPCN